MQRNGKKERVVQQRAHVAMLVNLHAAFTQVQSICMACLSLNGFSQKKAQLDLEFPVFWFYECAWIHKHKWVSAISFSPALLFFSDKNDLAIFI